MYHSKHTQNAFTWVYTTSALFHGKHKQHFLFHLPYIRNSKDAHIKLQATNLFLRNNLTWSYVQTHTVF